MAGAPNCLDVLSRSATTGRERPEHVHLAQEERERESVCVCVCVRVCFGIMCMCSTNRGGTALVLPNMLSFCRIGAELRFHSSQD